MIHSKITDSWWVKWFWTFRIEKKLKKLRPVLKYKNRLEAPISTAFLPPKWPFQCDWKFDCWLFGAWNSSLINIEEAPSGHSRNNLISQNKEFEDCSISIVFENCKMLFLVMHEIANKYHSWISSIILANFELMKDLVWQINQKSWLLNSRNMTLFVLM